MTDSFFYNESPDFASPLAETYKSVNISYDRRDELEDENDKTREKNAKMPLELLEKIVEFAPSAKQMFEGLKENAFDRNTADGWEDTSESLTNTIKDNLNDVYEINSTYDYIEAEAIAKKDTKTLQWLSQDGVRLAVNRDLFMLDSRNMLSTKFNQWIEVNYPDGFNDQSEALKAFHQFRRGWTYNMSQLGFNGGYIKARTEDKFDSIEATFLQNVDTSITNKLTLNSSRLLNSSVSTVFNSDNTWESSQEWVKNNLGKFGGNTARAYEFLLKKGIEHAKRGTNGIDQVEGILYEYVEGDKVKRQQLIEKLGGSKIGGETIKDLLFEIEEAKSKIRENITEKTKNYHTDFDLKLKKLEENGPLSKLELVDYIAKNWDWSVGGQLPDTIKGRVTAEQVSDFQHIALLENRYKSGYLITAKDINKIENLDLREKWRERLGFDKQGSKVVGRNELTPSVDHINQITEDLPGWADQVTNLKGIDDKNHEWNNVNRNGLAYYKQRYQWHVTEGNATSEQAAHAAATTDVKNAITKGKDHAGNEVDFTVLAGLDSEKARTKVGLDQIRAEKHIKEINPDVINTEIIYGTEDYIEDAVKLYEEKGETLLFYKQLAENLNLPITGAELQYQQIQVYKKLKNEKVPPKSKILLELEELKDRNPKAYELLTKHKDEASVIKATIEAYSPESENGTKIYFNEINNILPEIVNDFNIRKNKDSIAIVGEDGIVMYSDRWFEQITPKKGDYKVLPLPSKMSGFILQPNYVVWDGTKWVLSKYQGRGDKWAGTIQNYVIERPTYDEGGWHTGFETIQTIGNIEYDNKNNITGHDAHQIAAPGAPGSII